MALCDTPMVHSLVFVMVPPSVPDRDAAVSRLLEGASRDYDTYEVPCSCIGEVAFAEAWRQVDGSSEGQQWLRELELARERQDTTAERDVLRQRYKRFLSANRAHPQFGLVTADCEICQGRGVNEMSRNPAQHYDWWQIGGRWDGLLGAFSEIGPNVARIQDLRSGICPAAVVTDEGDWFEGPATLPSNAEFRELADIPEEELAALASWKQTLAQLVESYRGHLVVAVDCHS
jgi:hypothetical protein